MSRADVNALTIMSIAANCAINIASAKIPEESTSAMLVLITSKINLWPVFGDYKKIKSRVMSHCKLIEYQLKSSELFYSDPCCTARLAQYSLIELRDCTANAWKLSAIDEILDHVNDIVDMIDQHERNDTAINEAMRLVSVVKNQIRMD